MNHKERVRSALARGGYDRLPVRYCGEPVVNEILMAHFGVEDQSALLERLGDDLRSVGPRYCGPPAETFADGSLILGPMHLIQPSTPPENILAMYRAAGSLAE